MFYYVSFALTHARFATSWHFVLPILFLLAWLTKRGERTVFRLFSLSCCVCGIVSIFYWAAWAVFPDALHTGVRGIGPWDLLVVHSMPLSVVLLSGRILQIKSCVERSTLQKDMVMSVTVYFAYIVFARAFIIADRYWPYPFMDNLDLVQWGLVYTVTLFVNVCILSVLEWLFPLKQD
jgi:hypothetical protein